MPIHRREHLYPGVNAHLHSYFQQQGDWQEFHTLHLGDLIRALNERLLPLGYVARGEKSLQIREIHPDTGEKIRRPEPAVMVYAAQPPPAPALPIAVPPPAIF